MSVILFILLFILDLDTEIDQRFWNYGGKNVKL